MSLAEFRRTPKAEWERIFVAGRAPVCASCGRAFALDASGERTGIVAVLDIPLTHGGRCLADVRERFARIGITLNDRAFTRADPVTLTPEQLARALGRDARPWEHRLMRLDDGAANVGLDADGQQITQVPDDEPTDPAARLAY